MGETLRRKKFTDDFGRVVYLHVEEVTHNYPAGTVKVEATVYPVGPGSYSSFIYTLEPLSVIDEAVSKIARVLLDAGIKSHGSQYITDVLSKHIDPIFPKYDPT